MSIMRINKSKDYTVMSTFHLREKSMSLKAKGLLSLMLSLPEDWDYSVEGLSAICKEKESAIKSTLSELKDFGYLNVTKLYPNETESGRIEYVYDVFEQKQDTQKQGVEKQGVEILQVENQGQINIDNKILNNKNIYTPYIPHEAWADYETVVAALKELCPTIYARHANRINTKSDMAYLRDCKKSVEEVLQVYSIEELRGIFERLDQTYVVKPKYSKIDLNWILNNLPKMKQEIEALDKLTYEVDEDGVVVEPTKYAKPKSKQEKREEQNEMFMRVMSKLWDDAQSEDEEITENDKKRNDKIDHAD